MSKTNKSSNSTNAAPPVFDPEILELDEFWIYIFAVNNTNDIRGIIPYDNYINNMKKLANEMRIHYNNNEDSVPNEIKKGNYYTIFDDEWHRVRCVDYNPTNQTAVVLFIDRGDIDMFSTDYLQNLDSKFCTLPAQSVQLSLHKLEVFYDCEDLQESLDDLLTEKNVFVKIMSINFENEVPILSVDLTVEQDNNDEIYVNELLLQKIFESIADPHALMGVNNVAQEACISCINSDASVFVQIKSKGLIYFKILMDDVRENYLNNQYYSLKSIVEIDFSKLYAVKYLVDNSWYRAQIVLVVNENDVKVMFIDTGNIVSVKKGELFLLEDLSDVLARYPEQAVRAMLYKVSPFLFDENMAYYLYCLALDAGTIYMKVMDFCNSMPVVQFYKRTENNSLLSINDALVVETSSIKNSSSCEQKVLPLKNPDIPEDEAFFDVYVTMAANSDNITVQPLYSAKSFHKLMAKLLDVCESFSGPHLTPGCVKVGRVYAALNEDDDSWFRAYVCRIINEHLFTVYACDYGDYKVVPLKDLQPLQEEFLDLPYQAMKAKLNGVKKEIKENWSVISSLMLNRLIVCKHFVSYISSREFDDKSFDEVVLNLELIDTSSEEDIYISEVLNDKLDTDNYSLLDNIKAINNFIS